MKIKSRQTLSIIGIFFIVSFFIFGIVKLLTPKTGYVLIGEVFEKFEYKKEMQKKYELTVNARKRILDSLEINLNYLSKSIKSKDVELIKAFENKRMEYFQRKKLFDEDNQALTEQYDKEVINQLNQYVKDFGTEKGYTYIYGSDGNGYLMFADEKNNLTQDIVEFINKKYKGKS